MAYKTPGVYIVEKSAFPNSVVEVATAVPAFIGYTEKASNKGKPLKGVPWRISSMAEFVSYFGGPPTTKFDLKPVPDEPKPGADLGFMIGVRGEAPPPPPPPDDGSEAEPPPPAPLEDKPHLLEPAGGAFYLYNCMRLFFQNGGGPCYIVSVGDYSGGVDMDTLLGGIAPLVKEQEPTMVLAPDAMLLENSEKAGKEAYSEAYSLQVQIIKHCGEMMSRVAVLDVPGGYKDRQHPDGDPVNFMRGGIGTNYLDYAAAYYPWVRTTIGSTRDVSSENLKDVALLQTLILGELDLPPDAADDEDENVKAQRKALADLSSDDENEREQADKTLRTISATYQKVLDEILEKTNLLPPAAAMAGVYTMVDNTRGVWKAPANVSLNSVVAPSVNITHAEQEDLNVTPQGKSINAIRTFIGEGVLVWGARTLDGNSLDWRYVNVRRTMIMLEESIRLAAKAYVFDQNDAKTWTTMRSMIRNFLTGIWKRGGLAGASPEDAFSVHVGLGETMTPEDILEGILRVTVLLAISRPAEFIEITFQQQMQKS